MVSCQTAEPVQKIEVPVFEVSYPNRPILDTIPQDTSGAIKALTNNMRALATYSEKLEVYIEYMDS
jgi:hypothetical protein